jgi:cysteine desulfurase
MTANDATPIYLDYAATTPVDPRVAARMCEILWANGPHGNPSSLNHEYGRKARDIVEMARTQVASPIAARPEEIVFTSGATESNNLALFGAARFHQSGGRHIVSSRTEHKSVLDTLKQLEHAGFKVTYLKSDVTGVVHPEQVIEALQSDTVLVSLMHANNETGAAQDIGAVGRACRERGIIFHVDAAQSFCKLPINVEAMQLDLVSLTAHKIYGPKGVGALYIRARPPLGLQPLMYGGGQELNLRPGTLATHQIAGFGLACELAATECEADSKRIGALRKRLWDGLFALGGVELNGHATETVPGILNVAFHGVEGESLQLALRDLAISSGSACASASDEPSYVLRVLGRSDQLAQSSVRFSLGRFTTAEEIEFAVATVARELPRLRAIAP